MDFQHNLECIYRMQLLYFQSILHLFRMGKDYRAVPKDVPATGQNPSLETNNKFEEMQDTFSMDQEINDNIEAFIRSELTPSSSTKDVPATGQNPTQEPKAPNECNQDICDPTIYQQYLRTWRR